MLIITGSGRCGTATMARLFGGHHEFRAEYLLEKYFRALDPRQRAFRSRDSRLAPMLDLLQGVDLAAFVDSSNLYIHFLDVLPVIDPEVRVILAVRNVREFARSAIRRGWHQRSEYGMIPVEDDPWFHSWEGFSPVERAAWIWQYRNGLALDALAGYIPGRFTILAVEHLSLPGVPERLEEFAGRALTDLSAAGRRFNAGPGGQETNLRGGEIPAEAFAAERVRRLTAPLLRRFGYETEL